VEPEFHDDSYGYRPGRSQLDAVGKCRERCWRYDWIIDLDIQKFFDSVPWDRIVKAVEANTTDAWVILYVKRWLAAPLQMPDGSIAPRDRGTPQGSLCSASHKPPYEQRRVMRSAGLLALVTALPGAESCA
jgi:RNA-directed DNA polymerase